MVLSFQILDFNGDIYLLNPLTEVTEDIRQNRHLNYKLYLPDWSEIPPAVTKISLNGEEICYGDPVDNSIAWSITTINLRHSLTIPKTQTPKRRQKIKRPLNITTPRSASKTSAIPPQASTRLSRDLSDIFPSNPFFNPNYKPNFNTNLFSNNQDFTEVYNYGATARPETFTNINSQYRPSFQGNPFLSNYEPQNIQSNTVKHQPDFSNTQQNNYLEQGTEQYIPNPFLSGHMNNHVSSTPNQSESSNPTPQAYHPNFQNSNHVSIPPFEPHNNFPETTQQPTRAQITTTTRKSTQKRTSQIATTTREPTKRTPQMTTTTRKPIQKRTPQITITTRKPTRKQTPLVKVKDQISTTTNRPIQRPSSSGFSIVQRPRPFSSECGISVNPNMLVMNGSPVSRTMHPWLAAIFLQNNEGLKFICGSTLISRKHVMTAAHCVRDSRRKFKPEELWIILGRENIRMWSNDGAQTVQAESTHIHPDYKIKSADADIAIIVLTEEAIFSNLIRPACLWTDDIDVRSIVSRSGMVVGWGKDEFGNLVTAEPRAAEFPVVSEEDCLWSNAAFREITSNRTFCAGHRNNSGPCNGDSGGGFLMQVNNRWTLRGIVSMSLLRETDGTCDLGEYVVFTDAAQFLNWLLSFLQ